jgi:diguanylate cyclase (GGDEF)-like protein
MAEEKPVGSGSRPRVIILIAVLMALGAVELFHTRNLRPAGAPFVLPWWAFVPAFAAAEGLLFHVEIKQEAHSFSLSELPLVVGFFVGAPMSLVLGRVLGQGLFILLRRRQPPLKFVFNLSLYLAETATGVLVFHLTSNGSGPFRPLAWAAVMAGVISADTLSLAAVSLAIRWHGGKSNVPLVSMVALLTAAINTSLAVMAAIILWSSPWALGFFAFVALAAAMGYRAYTRLTRRYSSLQLLYDFTRMVGSSVRAETVMEQVLGEARKLMRAASAEIVLADRSTGAPDQMVRADGGEGASLIALDVDASTEQQDWVWDQVTGTGRPLLIPRGSKDPRHAQYLDMHGLKDCLVAPLRSEERVIGTIMAGNRFGEVSTFDHQDLRLFETLANHATVAFENGRLVEQLRREADERRHEALHDSLTGLPNRTLFIQRLTDVTGAGRSATVMLMDLDRFKEVNDTLGHHNGDLLLAEVARRLGGVLRPTDTVARLGGDEFAVLIPDMASAEEATGTGSRIVQAVQAPWPLGQLSLEVGASIGMVLTPAHGTDPSKLLQRADVAMYEAKADKSHLAFYSPDRDNYSPKRLALAAELRQAIENGSLLVYHQPQARLEDGRVVGTEALVRWHHPEHGLMPPDEFIPVAEVNGLIGPLTMHVLRSSLAACRHWRQMGHPMNVSVNLSVRSLMEPDLPERVAELLRHSGVPASALTLEITESGIMADPERTVRILNRLAGIGVRLSVDDFGTGYSSLSYLQRLPVNEVKVDRSFVFRMANDDNDATIVQSIVELGHNLGMQTVAEGVEDQVSWDRLQAMGCDLAQGYLLSRPIPFGELTRWLGQRRQLRATATSSGR